MEQGRYPQPRDHRCPGAASNYCQTFSDSSTNQVKIRFHWNILSTAIASMLPGPFQTTLQSDVLPATEIQGLATESKIILISVAKPWISVAAQTHPVKSSGSNLTLVTASMPVLWTMCHKRICFLLDAALDSLNL